VTLSDAHLPGIPLILGASYCADCRLRWEERSGAYWEVVEHAARAWVRLGLRLLTPDGTLVHRIRHVFASEHDPTPLRPHLNWLRRMFPHELREQKNPVQTSEFTKDGIMLQES